MKMFKNSLLICLAIFTLTCGGVYATFDYALNDPSSINGEIVANINEFKYLFPNTEEGKKHEQLTNNILNGTGTDKNSSGLNDPNSNINQVIKNRSGKIWANSSVLGSCDGHEKDNLSNLFDEDTKDMFFLIYFPDGVSDTYYLFTTTVDLGDEKDNPNIKYGEYVEPIYRTVLKQNADGKYEAIQTGVGKAISQKYKNYLSDWVVSAPSFDPTTWVEI